MSKKAPKPHSPLAKADAAITADHRKAYPEWDDDAAKYGVRTADFNAGFMEGDSNGREDIATNVLPVFRDLSARNPSQRRARTKQVSQVASIRMAVSKAITAF